MKSKGKAKMKNWYVKSTSCLYTHNISFSCLLMVESAGSCYAISLRDNHACVEDSMKSHCPICYEVWSCNTHHIWWAHGLCSWITWLLTCMQFLFDSTQQAMILKCGHTIHMDCYHEMIGQNQYVQPVLCFFSYPLTWIKLQFSFILYDRYQLLYV